MNILSNQRVEKEATNDKKIPHKMLDFKHDQGIVFLDLYNAFIHNQYI